MSSCTHLKHQIATQFNPWSLWIPINTTHSSPPSSPSPSHHYTHDVTTSTGSIGYPALADVIGKRAARILYSPHCAIFVFIMHPLVAILLPLLSHAVVLAMFPIGLYQTYAVTRKVSGMLKDIRIANRLRRAFWLGTMTCLAAVACWIVDKLGCDHIGGGFSRYGLHWCWHLLICLCAYLTTIVHVFCGLHNDEPRGLDIKTHKRLGMLMPVIRGGFLI